MTAAESNARRNHAIRWAIVTSMISKVGTALLQLISIPIAIRVLGLEVFGIYSTIAMGLYVVTLLQVGVGPALTHGLSRALAAEDREKERLYYSTAFFIIAALAIAGGTVIAAILTFVPIPVLFGAEYAKHEAVMRPALWVGLGIILVQLVLSHTERAREGYLEVNINNAWGAFGNFVGAIALASGIWFFPTIEFLLLCVFGSNALGKAGNTIHLLIRRPYIFPRLSRFRRKLARELLTDGVAFSFSSSVTGIVEFSACALIIAHLAGPSAVGIFNILIQIDTILLGFIVMLTTPTWPAVVDALARNDLAWIRTTSLRLRVVGLAYCSAAMIGLVSLGPVILPLWLGPEVDIPRLTLFAFSCFFMIGIWNHIHHSLLVGMGKVKQAVVYVILEAVVILGPASLGLIHFGLPGLFFGMCLTKLLISGTIFPTMLRRSLDDASGHTPAPNGGPVELHEPVSS